MILPHLSFAKILKNLAIVFVIVGIGLRIYQITQSDFVLYDEGFYLNYNPLFLNLMTQHFPSNLEEWRLAVLLWFRFSLASGKALWFLLSDSRAFFGWTEVWFIPRLISSIAGLFTLLVTFHFSRQFFTDFHIHKGTIVEVPRLSLPGPQVKKAEAGGIVRGNGEHSRTTVLPQHSSIAEENNRSSINAEVSNSKVAAALSVVFLAVLPSHVFYSRLAFQEALSTLFFISGFYFYLFPPQLSRRTFLAGVLFAGAYFTNYRLLIIPFLVACAEIFLCLTERRRPAFRKFLWTILTFFVIVVLVGNCDRAQNAIVTYSWMFHQGHLAQERFSWINLLSYPYYLFRLETFLFGVLFFINGLVLIREPNRKFLPFFIVLVQMIIFSFAGEKGARYLCVVTPFMAMAAAQAVLMAWEKFEKKEIRWAIIGLCLLALTGMSYKSFQIAVSRSDYRIAMQDLLKNDPRAQVLSTQPWVLNLYTDNKKKVYETPHNFRGLLVLYSRGFRYLALCPQTYISWTSNKKRFNLELEDYLKFVVSRVKPEITYPHLNRVLLERFVFEHNENLAASIAFLRQNPQGGELKIYRIEKILEALKPWMPQRPKTNL